MSLLVDIEKDLGGFFLQVRFESEGGVLGLLGPSGSGKSMTLKCIAGIERPDRGRIVLDGETLFDSEKRIDLPPQRRRVGYLFQSYALFPNMTVAQNILCGLCREPDRDKKKALLQDAVAMMRLEGLERLRPAQLSGGQAQRAALARILVSRPNLLMLDEPFSALDSYLKYQLELELAETLGGFPGTVLWVSHDRGEVFRNCRRVCVIDRGRSQPVTTLGELFRSPGTEAAARLSGCKNYADARPREDAVFLPDWGLTLSCGRPVPEGVCRIGIRAHHVQLAGLGAENAFSCTAVKVVEDVFSTIVLLRPEGAAPEAPLLRMELDKDNWQAVPDKDRLTVSVPPEAILLLES